MLLVMGWTINAQTATVPSSGDGSSTNPYQIASLENLYWISTNKGVWDKHFIQTADIDASQTSSWPAGGWIPIGTMNNDYSRYPFSGTYDGKDHTITGLTINRPSEISWYNGMFGLALGATFKNLGLLDVSITAYYNVGSLGARLEGCKVWNCHTTGTVTTTTLETGFSTGGIAASAFNSTLTNCQSACFVNGTGNVGGMVGHVEISTITNCYSSGNVGHSCATINAKTGGFVGEIFGSSLSKNFCTGNVTASGGASSGNSTGGFVGYAMSYYLPPYNPTLITDCYSSGNVNGGSLTGGFVGNNYGSGNTSTITNCYSRGILTGEGTLWGFVANNRGTVNNCYFDAEVDGLTYTESGDICYGATGKTTAEMKSQSTFSGWDFSTIWGVNEASNDGYPYLLPSSTCTDGSITLTSGTETQTICSGTTITPIVYTIGGGASGAEVTGLPVGFSGNYNGETFTINGTSSVTGSFTYTVTTLGATSPCINATASGTITVNEILTPFVNIVSSDSDNKICKDGAFVTFTATPGNVGGGSVAYHWFLNETTYDAWNANTWSSGELEDGDAVRCEITVTGGTCLTSATAVSNIIVNQVYERNVDPSVLITTNLLGEICYGTTLIFTATPYNTGGGTVAYQWKYNGIPIGSNSNIYTSDELETGDLISCDITVTDAACFSIITASSEGIGVTIYPRAEAGTINGTSMLCMDETVTFSVTGNNLNGNWDSANEKIATVDQAGNVTAVGVGSTTIGYLVDSSEPCNENDVATYELTVVSIPVVAITGNTEINVGGTTNLSPTDGGTWVSNNPTVALVDGTGEVTGISIGSATFTFTDFNTGCSATTEAITVTGAPPVFTLYPGTQTAYTASELCSALVTYEASVSGSPEPVITYEFSGATIGSGDGSGSGTVFNVGDTYVTITASNGIAPNATCSFKITVTDNQAPVITAEDDITKSADAGVCSAIVAVTAPMATDNCGILGSVVGTRSDAPLTLTDPFPVGTTTITWTVSDINGNPAAPVTQLVTVTDNEAPDITCAAEITQTADKGMCFAAVSVVPPVVTDNCDNNVLPVSSNDLIKNGNFNARDSHWEACGNTAEALTEEFYIVPTPPHSSNYVAEVDGEVSLCQEVSGFKLGEKYVLTFKASRRQNDKTPNPVSAMVVIDGDALNEVVTRTNTVFALTPESFEFTATQTTHTLSIKPGTDNKGSLGLIIDDVSVRSITYPVGTTTLVWTATDVHGNTATCEQEITVTDNEAPVIADEEDITQTAAEGLCSAAVTVTAPAVADNCGILGSVVGTRSDAPLTLTDPFPVGTTTITWTVSDIHENPATPVTQLVTVTDNEAPMITCPTVSPFTRETDFGSAFYKVVGGEFDATATDACCTPKISYECLSASVNSGSTMAGVQLPLGTHNITWTAEDIYGNKSTGQIEVTVQKRQALLTYTGDPDEQYSDETNLSAKLVDGTGKPVEGKTIRFTIGSQSETAVTGSDGIAIVTPPMKLEQSPIPQYLVLTEFDGDEFFQAASDEDPFDITQESALTEYTGQEFVGEQNPEVSTTPLILSASVTDVNDGYRGDIRNARVQFYDVNTLVPISEWLTPGLVDPTDFTQGLVMYIWDAPVPVTGYSTFTIGVKVGTQNPEDNGYYVGSDKSVVNVYRADLYEFITGGGHIIPTDSRGTYASDPGRKVNFGFNVKWNKTMKRLQGNLNLVFRIGGETYQVKTNSMTSLSINSVNPCSQQAYFTSKANLTRVTSAGIPEEIKGTLDLQVTMTNNTSPGAISTIGVTVYDGNTLLYSSNWPVNQTEELPLEGGNIVVHNGITCVVNNEVDVMLYSSKNPSFFGEEVIFEAVVTPKGSSLVPEGEIVFRDNEVVLETVTMIGGKATLTVGSLDEGDHPVVAEYIPSDEFEGAVSNTLIQQVEGAVIQLVSDKNPSIQGETVTFTATIIGPPGGATPTGTIAFADNEMELGIVSLFDGKASVVASGLSAGSHTITAVYSGDINYNEMAAEMIQVVNSNVIIQLTSSKNPEQVNNTVTFIATVTSSGFPVSNADVSFYVNGKELVKASTDGNGVAKADKTFTVTGTYLIEASCAGQTASLSQVIKNKVKSAVLATAIETGFKPADLKVYPNPFSDRLNFEFVSPTDDQARIDIFDLSGRRVETVFENMVKAGVTYNAVLIPDKIISGIYIYRTVIGDNVYNGKVMFNGK